MGFFDKLGLRKKEEPMDFDRLAETEMAGSMTAPPSFEEDHLGMQEKSPFGEEATPTQSPYPSSQNAWTPKPQAYTAPPPASKPFVETPDREMELINSKLDTLKAMLSSLDQRFANIERALEGEQKKQKLW